MLLHDVGHCSHPLFRRVEAEHASQREIGGDESAIRRRLENTFYGILKDAAIFLFRLLERTLRPFALSDILDRALIVDHRPTRIPNGAGILGEPNPATIPKMNFVLK